MGMKRGDLQAADESVLIDAAIQGDIEAFGYLHERYRSDLYVICLKRLRDPSLAEDAVQDVFIRGFASFPNFDRSKPFWPWLVAIAFRVCIDIQRRRSLTHYSGDIEVSVDAEANGATKSALEEVIDSEERAEFWKSLEVLPERQRRVFLSYTLDGLSCADVAAAEGISLGAVHMLLLRARRKMRAARQSGPLPAIVLPFTWLRWKVQRIEERIRPLLSVRGEDLSSACMQAVCLGTVAIVAVATSHPIETSERSSSTLFENSVTSATQLLSPQVRSLQTALPNVVFSGNAAVGSQQTRTDTAGSLADRMINPGESANPENTFFDSIVTSPNYDSDHTILASGYYSPVHVLMVSRDGGANWKAQPSRLLSGGTVVISPRFPHDQRMFAIGDLGLQQSDDGGGIFRTVSSPLLGWWHLTIPPSFGAGDSRVLIGGRTLLEYDADIGTTRPGSLAIPLERSYLSIALSPGYPSDPTVLISDKYGKGNLVSNSERDQTILYRCRGPVCAETEFPFPGPLVFRLSPRFEQDGLAYAFTPTNLLVSNDGTRTFQKVQFPLSDQENIADVAILWNASKGPAIFVSVTGLPSGIFRSFDSGHSWSSSRTDFLSHQYGAKKLIVTPTGRVLAAGLQYGIVCSEDRGQTWAPRCPPEK